MNKILKIINFWNIKSVFKIYALSLTIFTLFRVLLLLNELDRVQESTNKIDLFYSFIMGVRFDIVICGYILVLPFILLTINHLYFNHQLIKRFCFFFTYTLFTIAFLVNATDIPYFKQFFSRFSITAFEWIDNPKFVFTMIVEEPKYWLFILPFMFITFLFFKILKSIILIEKYPSNTLSKTTNVLVSLLMLALMFLGIRGRLEQKSPLRIGTAYFCNDPFINQLGLNPNFTLIKSYLEKLKEENKPINFMEDEIAISNVQNYFNIKSIHPSLPLLRSENNIDTFKQPKNIVLVIMESMSAGKMKRHGNKDNLTPFLDSLTNCGLYFENTYTSGIHTFNGIFSTLFSFPALFRQHPMKEVTVSKYHGIATTLKKRNYSTVYFTTHDGQFDNVEGFLKANDFDEIITKKDYPSDKIVSTLGVPDDYMFEFSIPKLNHLAKKDKPFLSVFMTASDHGPYYVPPYFKPKNSAIKKQTVEFADYSLRKFLSLAKSQSWFNNTLFVFIADHGATMRENYDISLDYNHSPLLFYQPAIIKNNFVYDKMAGQIDVFPSVMGLLGIPFENNTLGINLFKDERPYIYFNADDKYGVIDKKWLLIVKKDNDVGLFKYSENDKTNYSKLFPDIVKKMKEYAESNLQTFQYVVKKRKT